MFNIHIVRRSQLRAQIANHVGHFRSSLFSDFESDLLWLVVSLWRCGFTSAKASLSVCLFARVHICTHARMYACAHVYICIDSSLTPTFPYPNLEFSKSICLAGGGRRVTARVWRQRSYVHNRAGTGGGPRTGKVPSPPRPRRNSGRPPDPPGRCSCGKGRLPGPSRTFTDLHGPSRNVRTPQL